MVYDPVKAHEYYIRNRKLKGRDKAPVAPTKRASGATTKVRSTPLANEGQKQVAAKITRMKVKVDKLQIALTEALQALVEKRRNAAETEKKNSDGKTTVKERQAAQEWRDRNKEKLKSERSKDSGGGASSSSTKSVSSMSVDELVVRVSKIRTTLQSARDQLSSAQQALGQLAHSDLKDAGALLDEIALRPTISRKDSVKMTADFSGYATRNNLRCSDGRTILAGAFDENDGQIVPLVWSHGHDEPTNVLGHCRLEVVPDGVRAHAFFNSTAKGVHAKEMVKHGDVKFLSIFANQLKELDKKVRKGNIREVSLVLAGANPGAFIDHVNLAHAYGGEELIEDEAYITTGIEIEPNYEADLALAHADTSTLEEPETIQDVLDTLNEKQQTAVNYLLSQALTVESDADAVKHDDTDPDEPVTPDAPAEAPAEVEVDGTTDAPAEPEADDTDAPADADADVETSSDDTDTASDEDENKEEEPPAAPVNTDASAPADSAPDAEPVEATPSPDAPADDADNDTDTEAGDAVQHDNTNIQEDDSMTHNVFDQAKKDPTSDDKRQTLSHDDVKSIIGATLKGGSLKDAIEDYALQHGIENIDYLFPDAKLLSSSPSFVSRRMEWVEKVLNGVRKTPFSRIKSVSADLTPDAARAKGYVKGNMKDEEFFELSKRETTPQTIYKKQKLDRDDVLDITDLDVIAWMKAEMKLMLDEEIAGAILVGDGRSSGDDDKIKADKVRPIASDAELYVTTAYVNLDDASSSVEELVDSVIEARQYYKGTGTPTFYTSEAMISKFLQVKDGFGHRLYKTLDEVTTVLRVREIVPVEVLDRDADVVGIMVNLADYSIGTDRGGQATMFDDFDLDYNKLRYLLETRLCGALTLPKSAVVFRKTDAASVLRVPTEPAFDEETNVLTVPTITGVVYKNEAGDTLTTGAPVTLTAETSPYLVKATPASGSHFATNANDEWIFEYQA